jgi:hypothetical protein
MKLQPRHAIAAPFLAIAVLVLFDLVRDVPRLSTKGWDLITFKLIFSGIMILAVTVPGILALQRRWEDFVKILGAIIGFFLVGLISHYSSQADLAHTAENFIGADYPLLGALWGGCIVFAPFAVAIGAYKLCVPRIIRRIYRDVTPPVSPPTAPQPHIRAIRG